MPRFALTALIIVLVLGVAWSQDAQPQKEPSKEPSSHEQRISQLTEVNATLRKKLRELEESSSRKTDLEKQVAGKSYRITIGGRPRIWTFHPSRVLFVNGKPSKTQWITFGEEGVVCIGFDTANVDVCTFNKDGKTCEVIYVGDFRESSTRHPGELVQ